MVDNFGTDCRSRSDLKHVNSAARRILLIEDNADSAETMAMLLEFNGHCVSVAADGAQGLQRFREFNPDIVLCDIGLPGELDGYGVARELSASGEHAVLIAMTGYDGEEDRRNSAAAGFELHLVKPIDPGVLEDILANLPARREF